MRLRCDRQRSSTNSPSSRAAFPRAARCRCSRASCSRPQTAGSICTPPTWSSPSRLPGHARSSATARSWCRRACSPTWCKQPAPTTRSQSRPARQRCASGRRRQGAFSLNSWAASDFPQMSTFDIAGGFAVAASRSSRRSARSAGPPPGTRRGPSSPACWSPSSAACSRWWPPTATG